MVALRLTYGILKGQRRADCRRFVSSFTLAISLSGEREPTAAFPRNAIREGDGRSG